MINHLAIIMDGNRRWAKKRLLPSFMGHKAGFKKLHEISILAKQYDIKHLTVWALSTDNLDKRGKKEVEGIIKLINSSNKLKDSFNKHGVSINIIGNIDKLPEKSIETLEKLQEDTKNNEHLLTVALVYGGQDEIVRATKKIIKSGIDPDTITKDEFKKYLDTSSLPNPDIIVRTGGDIRHSGFLLFDSEYSEYYFTDKLWPDFDEEELKKVINSYSKSKRNFGK